MGDISSGCSVLVGVEPMPGFRLSLIQTASTADDGDTIVLTSLTGLEGVNKIFFATANADAEDTGRTDPMEYTANTAGSVTLTIGGSTNDETREILVISD